ncbi:MAG TPA: hypothetical protein VNV82_20015 [Bryobacteraceae bacterium]|nr:hypothetical protein [Bryobacteraceae bacterium]
MRTFALLGCTCTFLASLALAQPSGNPQAFTCIANAGTAPTLRAEGITELVGDLLLQCTGGTPTPAGQIVPPVKITLTLNTNFTSRLLPSGLSDALLLIDEPGATNQRVCTTAPCSQTATGNGSTPTNAPNVFLGRQTSVSAVEWDGIPIDAPSTAGVRVVRLTNVRANANQLGLNGPPGTTPITGFIQITGNPAITVVNPLQTLATAEPGSSFSVLPGSFQFCSGFNGNQLFSENTPGVPGPATAHLVGSELFPFAFKPPGTTTPQNVPGQVYNTESGFTIPSQGIGTANFGTVFQGTIENVPPGVKAQVPLSVPLQSNSSSNLGTAVASQTGTISGSNSMTLTPDASGNISFFYQVTQRIGTGSALANIDVPVTFSGGPSQSGFTGYNIIGVLNFANSQFPQTTLFTPTSSLLNPIPIFGPLDPGVTNPAIYPYQEVASIVPCTNQGNTLSVTSPSSGLSFMGVTNPPPPGPSPVAHAVSPPPTTLIAPRLLNVGLISAALPSSNITVLKDSGATWLNATLNQSTTPATLLLSVNPTSAGSYTTTLQVSSPLVAGNSIPVPVTYNVGAGPWFTRYGFANSASYISNVVAPGEPFVIFGGDNFGPAQIALPQLGPDGRVVSTVGNTQVLFDGAPAPLYYSVDANGFGQVAGFAPFALDGKTQTTVQVVYNNFKTPPVTLFVLDAVPGLYTADASGGGQGSILNQDQSINSSTNPESVGNLIVLYGGGAGQTNPKGRDGALAGVGGPLAQLKLPVKVFIDGIQATDIPYAGPAPGLVEGVFQINVRIPAGVRRNTNVPVLVQIEDKQTQPGVTVATQ